MLARNIDTTNRIYVTIQLIGSANLVSLRPERSESAASLE